MAVFFSDYFDVKPDSLKEYNALNISLVSDLPLFLDPFLLFESKDGKYDYLKDEVINYFSMLNDINTPVNLCRFPEVPNNWLGFCVYGCMGKGLSLSFALNLKENIHHMFSDDFIHIGKLSLIKANLGTDNISDMIVNILKGFFLEYTEKYAKKYLLNSDKAKNISVKNAVFNYGKKRWEDKEYYLPYISKENSESFIILTPKDLLSKNKAWINRESMVADFDDIVDSLSNEQLRLKLRQLEIKYLPVNQDDCTAEERKIAKNKAIDDCREFIKLYIEFKIDNKRDAFNEIGKVIDNIEIQYINNINDVVSELKKTTDFYNTNDVEEKVDILKTFIENGYIKSLAREIDKSEGNKGNIERLFNLIWLHETPVDNLPNKFKLPFNIILPTSLNNAIKREEKEIGEKRNLVICYSNKHLLNVNSQLSKTKVKYRFEVINCSLFQ